MSIWIGLDCYDDLGNRHENVSQQKDAKVAMAFAETLQHE